MSKIIICGSCGIETEKFSSHLICRECMRDYRYNSYRRYITRQQKKAGKPLSGYGSRWNKEEMRVKREEIIKLLLGGSHKEIRVSNIKELFEVGQTFANKILQQLQAEGKIIRVGTGRYTYYEVVRNGL